MLDANTVASAVLKRNSVPERALLQALEKDVLCLSEAVFREYEEVLQRPKLAALVPPGRSDELLGRILAAGLLVEPATSIAECRDLLDLDPWRGVRIAPAAVYLGRAWSDSERKHP